MMLNETLFLGVGECPIIRPEGIYYGGRKVIALDPSLGVGATTATWVDWYNAHGDEQSAFDDAAAVLDDTTTTPTQKQNYIDVFGGSSGEKAALQNYVATGGRRALFATPPKDYGKIPIAVIKPAGPIEKALDGVTLHPGTYTYSNVSNYSSTGDKFEDWAQNNAKTVKRTILQTSASFGNAEYLTDNALVVYQDTLWPSSLNGLPTWLPPGTDPIQYWGKVTPHADWDWGGLIPDFKPTVHWLGAVLVVTTVVVGGALIVYYIPRRSTPSAMSRS